MLEESEPPAVDEYSKAHGHFDSTESLLQGKGIYMVMPGGVQHQAQILKTLLYLFAALMHAGTVDSAA